MHKIDSDNLREIYFAGGCFWGVEEYFSRVPGVYDATSGYANGTTTNPGYAEVCTGATGHAETVCVEYDPAIISLKTLAEAFFKIIDPTSLNRQGFDTGTQYRSGVYYTDKNDLAILQSVFDAVARNTGGAVVTELLPLSSFYKAEEEHQDYLTKNPYGYCHIDFSSLDEINGSLESAAPAT